VVEQIRKVTKSINPTGQTILYGSEARGDANPNSDIDLLLLLPEKNITPEKHYDIVKKLYEIELETGVVISSMILPKDEWVNKKLITPFYLNVCREGVTL